MPVLIRLLPALLLLILAGCVSSRTANATFDAPYSPRGPKEHLLKEGSLDELRSLIAYRTPHHDLFWARAGVRIRQRDVDGVMWFDSTLIYRNPDAIRLRGSRPAIGTLFEVILSGEQAWVHLNREKELYGGTLDELKREGGVLGSFSLRDMMAAILVNHDLEHRLATHEKWQVRKTGDDLLATYLSGDGRRFTWVIRREDGLVREVIVRNASNQRELRIEYLGYKLEGAEPLPTALTLHIWEDAMTIELKIDEYKTAPAMKPENVDYLPPGLTARPLRNLRDREAILAVENQQ